MGAEPSRGELERSLRQLGTLLKERRQALRRSAKSVALAAGITPAYLWMIEGGLNPKTGRPSRPSVDVLARLVATLQLPPDEPFALAGYSPLSRSQPPPTGDSSADRAPTHVIAPQHLAVSSERARPPLDDGMLPWPEQLVGRDADLDWLLGRLHAGGTVSLTALGGMGGIGKTALAAVALRQLRAEGRFPDGLAVVHCQGLSDPAEVLRQALARFHPQRRQPETRDLVVLAETAQSLLDGKRALIMLDNVEPGLPVEQVVTPLRAAGAALMITARQALPRSVVPVDASRALGLLESDAALDLFAQSYGRPGADALGPAERDAGERIIAALGRHTLAVKLAAAYAADAHRDLGALARELENPERAMALPEGEAPEAVRRVFAQSVEALDGDARRLFVALAGFATAEFGREAALALAAGLGLAAPDTSLNLLVLRALLSTAVNESMPEGSDRERLRLHPLVRAFALAEWNRQLDEEREVAQRAIASHYALYARGVPDRALDADEENIVGALEWAHEHACDELVVSICTSMRTFWHERGRTTQSLRYLPWGVSAAENHLGEPTAGDPGGWKQRANDLAWLLHDHGYALQLDGEMDAALRRYERCLELARQSQNQGAEGIALYRLGQVAQWRGRCDDAEEFYHRSIAIRRERGDRQGEASILARLGQVARVRGRLEEAERYYRQCLAIRREVDDRRGEGAALAHLGNVCAALGHMEEAEGLLRQALGIDREVQDRRFEGIDLGNLGEVTQTLGRLDEAEVLLRQSLVIRREVHDRRGQATVLRQLALLAEKLKDVNQGESLYRESLAIARSAQAGPEIANTLLEFGRFLVERLNKREEGCMLLSQAVKLYAEMGLPRENDARAVAARLGCAP